MIELLYQDAHLLVCCKPAGLLSEGDGPDCLPALLSAQCGGGVFPVHRLDRGASGLMVFARTPKAAAALSRAVQEKQLHKEYFARVSGVPCPAAGEMTDLLFKDSKKGKVFTVRRPRRGVREARLTYETLETRGEGASAVSLVRIRLDTGRTHQIRVQFSSRGMPLLGDGKYGSRVKGPLSLFSCRLAFPHPGTARPLDFSLPLPSDWLSPEPPSQSPSAGPAAPNPASSPCGRHL